MAPLWLRWRKRVLLFFISHACSMQCLSSEGGLVLRVFPATVGRHVEMWECGNVDKVHGEKRAHRSCQRGATTSCQGWETPIDFPSTQARGEGGGGDRRPIRPRGYSWNPERSEIGLKKNRFQAHFFFIFFFLRFRSIDRRR